MKHLLYILMSLVVIAAIIPQASASYNCSLPEYMTFIGNAPWTFDSGVYSIAQANSLCNACGYGNTAGGVYFNYYNSNGGQIGYRNDGNIGNYTVSNNLTRYVARALNCVSGTKTVWISDGSCHGQYVSEYAYREPRTSFECSAGTIPDYPVNFTGSPLLGSAPLTVLFSTVNVTNSTGLTWSFGDGNITSSTLSALTHFYQNQGTYTVRLDYFNNSGVAGFIQKNNYISVGAPNATKTKFFQTIDGTNGNIVLNSSIQLKDVENSSWVNATGLTADGMSSITTLTGHHINAYAQALGYSDADDLNILNDGTPRYIMMWPTFAKNVSAGNVSLYVTVKDKDTKANLFESLVKVTLSNGNPIQQTYTNEAGIAYFVVPNNTLASVTAYAGSSGYAPGTTTINTGSGSGGSASAAVTILLGKKTVTPTTLTVVTTLPGGGTPTPTTTILPGCEDQISAEGQAKCRAAQSNQGLSFLSANMMDLIMICVFVTMLYLLGIKLGR